MKNLNKKNSLIKQAVLKKIETEAVIPKSKIWFFYIDGTFWILWAISVLCGAISFAMIEMVWIFRRYDLFEATHKNLADFIFEIIPYIWLISFLIMSVMAFVNLRNTRRGYRYPFYQIVFGGLLFSIIGGLFLHFAGLSNLLDKQLGKSIDFYMSQEKMEFKMWQNPSQGKLVGILLKNIINEPPIFRDVSGKDWQLAVHELDEIDLKELYKGNRVRLLGAQVELDGSDEGLFYVCGVLPWLFTDSTSSQNSELDRNNFITRMNNFKTSSILLQNLKLDSKVYVKCSEIDVVKRLDVNPKPVTQ